jgi:hypothetical protein
MCVDLPSMRLLLVLVGECSVRFWVSEQDSQEHERHCHAFYSADF